MVWNDIFHHIFFFSDRRSENFQWVSRNPTNKKGVALQYKKLALNAHMTIIQLKHFTSTANYG